MKGWLDNYNDSKTSAPEGFQGEGYSMKGRNYSPAWGGSFQEGGIIPIAQDGRATRADSLFLLKNNKIIKDLQKKGYTWDSKYAISKNPNLWKKTYDTEVKGLPKLIKEDIRKNEKTKPYNTYIDKRGKFVGTQDWLEFGGEDYFMPKQYIHPDIVPQFTADLGNKSKNHFISSYGYDDLAITPFDMLTPEQQKERVKKYGTDGVPKSYLNKSKPTTTVKPSTKKPIVDPKKKPLINPTKLNVEGLQPMSVGLQDINNGFETNLDIPTPVQRQPKYYDVRDVNNQYGGGDTQYRVDSLDELRELPKEQWDRKITPHYQMGGNIYPVNYVPQAQMGMSMPGATGHMYARVGAPSNGPYAKKTKASAKTGKVIKDDLGQWAHPGEITEIGSNNITMQGVPYDVLGISDEGDIKHMKANNPTNYKYKGNKVTEFPMAQNGKSFLEQLKADSKARKNKVQLRELPPTAVNDVIPSASKKAAKADLAREKDVKYAKDVQRKFNALPKEQQERILYDQYNQEHGTISPYTPQDISSRTWEVATHPMTAFGYAARNENLPEHFSRGKINAHEQAVDMVNPFFYLDQAGQFGQNLYEGNLTDAGLNALAFVPAGAEFAPELRAIGKEVGTGLKEYGNVLRDLPKAKSLKEAAGRFAGFPIEGALPRMAPEELKTFRQVQEIGRMRATGKPISEQYRYALEQNIPDEHFEKVFGRTKSEVEQILPSVSEQEAFRSSIPIRERFNLERQPRRRSSSDTAIDQINNQLDIRTASPEQIQEFADRVGMSVDEFTQFAESSLPPQTRDGVIRHTLSDYGSDSDIERLLERTYNPNELRPIPEELLININNRGRTIINGQNPRLTLKETAIDDWERYVDNKVPTSEAINNKFANIVSKYPYYKGPVLENVTSLSLSTSGTLKNVSKKVGDQSVSGISSGDIFTGSLNTSHSSYLPQIKQIFKYTEGAPQFLGYKPMNHLGFLSDFRYSQDDIAKYLNTEIDEQIRRGVIPSNIQRPYAKGEQVLLPHYGIKQFRQGGNIRQEQKGLVNLDQLTNFTNYNTKQPGGWLDFYK